jgi:hypothetical protein
LKVAIITDQHFGARSDSVGFLDFFEKFYDNVFFPTLDANSIDTVLILGDTFDRRKYVNFYSLQRAKEMFFDKLASRNITVHMLAGNHDTYYKNTNDVNSPDLLLREYNNINVIDHPATIYVDKTPICMMPWICPENYQDSIDTLKDTQAELCMGHFEIAGFAMYRGMESHDGLSKGIFDSSTWFLVGIITTVAMMGTSTTLETLTNSRGKTITIPEDFTCLTYQVEISSSSEILIVCLRELNTTTRKKSRSTSTLSI